MSFGVGPKGACVRASTTATNDRIRNFARAELIAFSYLFPVTPPPPLISYAAHTPGDWNFWCVCLLSL